MDFPSHRPLGMLKGVFKARTLKKMFGRLENAFRKTVFYQYARERGPVAGFPSETFFLQSKQYLHTFFPFPFPMINYTRPPVLGTFFLPETQTFLSSVSC